eukprot:751638-Pelagomonas_calceolata.AAC.2
MSLKKSGLHSCPHRQIQLKCPLVSPSFLNLATGKGKEKGSPAVPPYRQKQLGSPFFSSFPPAPQAHSCPWERTNAPLQGSHSSPFFPFLKQPKRTHVHGRESQRPCKAPPAALVAAPLAAAALAGHAALASHPPAAALGCADSGPLVASVAGELPVVAAARVLAAALLPEQTERVHVAVPVPAAAAAARFLAAALLPVQMGRVLAATPALRKDH